jgi:hypothetical protein
MLEEINHNKNNNQVHKDADIDVDVDVDNGSRNRSDVTLAEEYTNIVEALEKIETEERIKCIPSLLQRAPPLEFDDLDSQTQMKTQNGQVHKKLKQDIQGTNSSIVNTDNNNTNVNTNTNTDNLCNGNNNTNNAIILQDGTTASFRRFNLRTFSLSMILPPSSPSSQLFFLQQLTTLDLSNNELMDIPGLSSLSNLQILNLERGWFNTLPNEIGSLKELHTLNASRNFLRPNAKSLQITQLKSLPKLKYLDLTYNQKCGTKQHYKFISDNLQALPIIIDIRITLWEEVGSKPGSYVGASASERNPRLLRSQLEPWGTVQLRKRLVQDFNQIPTDASVVDRAGVMERLLECYEKEGLMNASKSLVMENNDGSSNDNSNDNYNANENSINQNNGFANRKRIYVDGKPVCQELIDELLVELRSWTNETGLDCKNRERPSIDARNYMILRKPKEEFNTISDGRDKSTSTRASRRAIRKAKKLSKYRKIWDLAMKALRNVDPIFATQCTEIAVTFGFQGSPHIDKQNSGPFYGLALGNFTSGQGGVCVECSARVVAVVNTKNRLGRVDGRYPHWVDEYDKQQQQQPQGVDNAASSAIERYSLIYYETGGNFKKPGPAIFDLPRRHL